MTKPEDKPDKPDKPDKDSPLDHDQGQGNDPKPDQGLPKPESPTSPESPPEAEPK